MGKTKAKWGGKTEIKLKYERGWTGGAQSPTLYAYHAAYAYYTTIPCMRVCILSQKDEGQEMSVSAP